MRADVVVQAGPSIFHLYLISVGALAFLEFSKHLRD